MAKKIRIVKASSPTFWYVNRIGEVFEVVFENVTSYTVKRERGLLSVVSKSAAEEVIEHNSQLYRKVDRHVREGDTVLITKLEGEEMNRIFTVERLSMFAGDFRIDEFINGDNYVEAGVDKFIVLEAIEPPIEQPVQPSAPGYAEVSELLHEASRQTRIDNAFDKVVARNGAALKRLADSDKQSPTLTETDLIANLAQEVAELKRELSEHKATVAHRGRTLEINVGELKDDIADLEDRLDENEKDTEEVEKNLSEVIGRINDLGDGAEAAAVVPVAVIENVIAELETREITSDNLRGVHELRNQAELAQFSDGRAHAFLEARELLEEALRNG